jgi:type IV pilus assembly protein PilM
MARKKTLPIGVDLGSSAAKLVQMRLADGGAELLACGTVPIPKHLRNDQFGRLDHLTKHIPRVLKEEHFRGKRCILALPASNTYVRHVRVPKQDRKATKDAVLRAVQVELPYPIDEAILRHIVAGDIYEGGTVRQEVIVVAMPNSTLKAYLNMFTRVGLEVLGVSVEPVAIVNCFTTLLGDPDQTTVFVDLGTSSTQVTISRGQKIVFSRCLEGGGDQLNAVIAQGLDVEPEEVRQMRIDLQEGRDMGVAGEEISRWVELWLDGLCREIDKCLRYYESVFRNREMERLIFTGGQAQDRQLCQKLAQHLNLPAQIGDSLALLGNPDGVKTANPGWSDDHPKTSLAVAVGLSLSGLEL